MSAWTTVEQARASLTLPDGVTDEQLARALDVASELLTGLSGHRPFEEHLVAALGCGCEQVTGPYGAVDTGAAGMSGGPVYWWRTSSGLALAGGACGCELALPDDPVLELLEVQDASGVVPAESYELVDTHIVRRTVGPWLMPTRVRYRAGAGIGAAGLLAMLTLASELLKAEVGDAGCKLPQRVQSVTRQGVSFAFLDPQTFLENGRTGLYAVDLWLASTRQRTPRRSTVVSPDTITTRRLEAHP